MNVQSFASITMTELTTPRRAGERVNSHVVPHYSRNTPDIGVMRDFIATKPIEVPQAANVENVG